MRLFTLLLLLFAVSCSTTPYIYPGLEYIVTDPKDSSKYLGGTVVYNPYGMKTLVKIRKKEAFSRMNKVCGRNNFKILKEELADPNKKSERYKTNHKLFMGNKIIFIEYRCKS